MMSDPASVDGTTVDELTGRLVLLIEENRAWDETDLMHRQLTAKIKHYVRYIRSPRFAVEHGRKPQDAIVRLVTAHYPGDESQRFFERVSYELSKNGISFEHQVGPDGIPVPLTPSAEATFPPRAPATEPRPTLKPTSLPPAAAPPPKRPPLERPLELEPAMPPEWLGTESEAAANSEISELERLIEGGDKEREYLGIELQDEAVLSVQPAQPPPGKRRTHPAFFPEEEFGRAMPDVDEVEAIFEASIEAPVIETSSGRRIRLDAAEKLEIEASAAAAEARPSLTRAIGAGIAAAIGGAVIWSLLAVPAAQGASPLALAVALMVSISVRLQGDGHSLAFRLVGVLFTLIGCLLGALLAAAALTATAAGVVEPIAPDHPVGLTGLLSILTSPDTALAAVRAYYGPLDLAALAIALYLGFRISATKPSN